MVFINYREHASIKKNPKTKQKLKFFQNCIQNISKHSKKLTSSESSDITITKPDFVQKLHTMEL
jgi:hypothetical protein